MNMMGRRRSKRKNRNSTGKWKKWKKPKKTTHLKFYSCLHQQAAHIKIEDCDESDEVLCGKTLSKWAISSWLWYINNWSVNNFILQGFTTTCRFWVEGDYCGHTLVPTTSNRVFGKLLFSTSFTEPWHWVKRAIPSELRCSLIWEMATSDWSDSNSSQMRQKNLSNHQGKYLLSKSRQFSNGFKAR